MCLAAELEIKSWSLLIPSSNFHKMPAGQRAHLRKYLRVNVILCDQSLCVQLAESRSALEAEVTLNGGTVICKRRNRFLSILEEKMLLFQGKKDVKLVPLQSGM